MYFIVFIYLSLGLFSKVYAELPPVVDLYENNPSENRANQLNLGRSVSSERLLMLERQVASLITLSSHITRLEQQLKDLRIQFEKQKNDLQILQNKTQTQYQELNQRIESTVTNKTPDTASPIKKTKAVGSTPIAQPSPPPPSKSASGKHSHDASMAYQEAIHLLKKENYDSAIKKLEDFLKHYPQSEQEADARYFLASVYLLKKKINQSIAVSEDWLKRYPKDTRAPRALYNLGLAYYAKNDKKKALTTFQKVVRSYPQSKAAQSAKSYLQNLQD